MEDNITKLPAARHRAVEEVVEQARIEAQHTVQREVAEFLKGCHGEKAPTAVVIVYRNPDGSLGYSAPEGDGITQAGMLDAAALVLRLKMVGVMR